MVEVTKVRALEAQYAYLFTCYTHYTPNDPQWLRWRGNALRRAQRWICTVSFFDL